MSPLRGFCFLLFFLLVLSGCATAPSTMVHYTIKQDPGSRPLQQIVLLPVDVDVYELSVGGVKEEVPEWSSTAETNIRNALLVSKGSGGKCCVTRPVDTASLTADEREILEEHLALFNTVATNAMWATLPYNTAWHFKADHFDYTLGEGLAFLKEKYGLDAGLVITGEDVVSSSGRKTTAVLGAMVGIAVPLGHSILTGGLVDFSSGDLLWLNHVVSAAGQDDLRDPASCLELAGTLMKDYPGLSSATSGESGSGY
ncbi:MAG: hypothetical protein PVH38_12020 [Gammaproteobacteria bacterium]|jgi:hypothetical protein